jgi:hypothetical protein
MEVIFVNWVVMRFQSGPRVLYVFHPHIQGGVESVHEMSAPTSAGRVTGLW